MTFANNNPISYYDLRNSPDIIVDASRKRTWADTRYKAPFVSLLEMLNNRATLNSPSNSKKCIVGVGDYHATVASLSTAFVRNTSTTIHLDEDRFFEGDVIKLFETDSHKYLDAVLTTKTGSATWQYTELATNAASDTFSTANTVVHILSPAVPWDGKARPYLNKKGDTLFNWAQRVRDSIGLGKAEQSETFLVEHDMVSLTRKGFEMYAEKWDKALMGNMVARGGANEQNGWGLTGGLPFFYNPHGTTLSDSGGIRTLAHGSRWGKNKVVSASNWSFNDFHNWALDLSLHGSHDKVILISPANYLRVKEALADEVAITRGDLSTFVPGMDAWNIPKAEMEFCNFWFLINANMTGMPAHISQGGVTSDFDKYMIAVDPKHVGFPPYIMKGKVMESHTVPIAPVDNDSVERVEFDSFKALVIDEPLSGGYLGLYTS